ncbi:MAG: flagellar motor switch protein FliG [Oscillospiraceae bacterium]
MKKLTSTQKAAAVMVALGAENASKVYKFLGDDEVEQLTLGVSKLQRLSNEDMNEIVDDFYSLCLTQKVISEGGTGYARDILEKAFGTQQAIALMDRISKALQTKAFEFIRKSDAKSILMVLQNEHPQTIGLVLSYARADQASQVIAELPRDVQVDVIQRIANLESISPEVVNLIESFLEKKFAAMVSINMLELGGVNYIADIMKHVDRGTEKRIFDELNEVDPALSENIRNLMFVFEDIVFLDGMAIQRMIREVDSRVMAVALKSANEDVTNVIFQNMSQRMKEAIQTDIQYLHNVRLRDVEEAQQSIVLIIRQLEAAGEIVISKGGGDDIIA